MFRLPKKPTNRPLLIYTIDDSEYYMELIKSELDKIGYHTIIGYPNESECLLEITKNEPDIVMFNCNYFGSGYNVDILKILKINHKNIKIIMLSESSDVDVAKNFINKGAIDYIIKDKLTIFRFENTMNLINETVNIKDLYDWESKQVKRVKILYISVTLVIFIISMFLLYLKN